MKIPLLGGAYTAKSVIANAQRCVNLYPEANPPDAEEPSTHYLTPGISTLGSPSALGPGRALYRASNGKLFGIVAGSVYYINPVWVFQLLGTISTNTAPAFMTDNKIKLVITDGSAAGFEVDLISLAFSPITDPNWQAAGRCDVVDTFLLFPVPNTSQFFTSLSNEVSFDPLYVASKSGFPDDISNLIAMHREIWLIGTLTTEIWYNAGNPQFPFAIFPGTFIEHGCVAPASISKHDLAILWLSQDKDGQAIAVTGENYKSNRVSTYAVEQEWKKYSRVDDAVTYSYQQNGHVFWVMSFPTADKTWVFDRSTGLWHERVSIDTDGNEHRWRVGPLANAYGRNVGLDWETGRLYLVDENSYVENGIPMVRRRGFPHLINNGDRVSYSSVAADIEGGTDDGSVDGATGQDGQLIVDDNQDNITNTAGLFLGTAGTLAPQINLRISYDRGKSFGVTMMQELGNVGEYLSQPQWSQCGMGRDVVFELYWSCATFTALNGLWVDSQNMAS